MTPSEILLSEITSLQAIAETGFALALHIEYTRPTFLLQSYPDAWIKTYSEEGLVMNDPTVHWGFENEGSIRWSSLAGQDTANVLGQAATFGMKYGMTCAIERAKSRSIASFSQGTGEFPDEAAERFLSCLSMLHDLTADRTTLGQSTANALADIGVDLQQPGGQ